MSQRPPGSPGPARRTGANRKCFDVQLHWIQLSCFNIENQSLYSVLMPTSSGSYLESSSSCMNTIIRITYVYFCVNPRRDPAVSGQDSRSDFRGVRARILSAFRKHPCEAILNLVEAISRAKHSRKWPSSRALENYSTSCQITVYVLHELQKRLAGAFADDRQGRNGEEHILQNKG